MKIITLFQAAVLLLLAVYGAYASTTPATTCSEAPALTAEAAGESTPCDL